MSLVKLTDIVLWTAASGTEVIDSIIARLAVSEPTWTKETNMGVVPQSDGWTLSAGGGGSDSVSGGILTLISSTFRRYLINGWGSDLNTQGVTVYLRAIPSSIASSSAGTSPRGIQFGDGSRLVQINIRTKDIQYMDRSAPAVSNIIPDSLNAGMFYEIWMSVKSNVLDVFIRDTETGEWTQIITDAAAGTTTFDRIIFGSDQNPTVETGFWDFIRYLFGYQEFPLLTTSPTIVIPAPISVGQIIDQWPITEDNDTGASITWDYEVDGGGLVTGKTLAQVAAALVGTAPTTLNQLIAHMNSNGLAQPRFNLNGGVISGSSAGDYPAEADVRLGVDYNTAALTGSLEVPAKNKVVSGVATDDGVGTYLPATPADVLLAVEYGEDSTGRTGTLLRYAVPTDANDTVRQQIMDVVATRMATILISNGYKTDAGANVFEWKGFAIADSQLPGIFPKDIDVRKDNDTIGQVENRLTVSLIVAAKGDEATVEPLLRLMIADVIQAIGTDVDWSGLAQDTDIVNEPTEFEQLEKKVLAARLDIEILYTTDRHTAYAS